MDLMENTKNTNARSSAAVGPTEPDYFDLLMQRLFAQLDKNSNTLSKVTDTLSAHATMFKLYGGMIVSIFMFLLLLGLNTLTSKSDSGDTSRADKQSTHAVSQNQHTDSAVTKDRQRNGKK
jgi:hypothetical protein